MKIIFKFFFGLFITLLIYIYAIKYINPPVTTFQIEGILYVLNKEEYSFHRDYIDWEEMGKNIKLAAISGEDQSFLDHSGFDWKSLQKSVSKDKNTGSAASTITQQMVKNTFLWKGEGFTKYFRKALEFPITFLVEKMYSKKRILEVYLNIAEMGPGIYGIEAAAEYYFNKESKDLTKNEAAKIISCLPNPKKFLANKPNVKTEKRSQWIIKQMRNIENKPQIKEFLNN